MDTALYYFLSTVAQTSGAAAALLGALVLFRMSFIASESTRAADHLKERFAHPDPEQVNRMNECWVRGDLEAVLAQSHRLPPEAAARASDYDQARMTLSHTLQSARVLRRNFTRALTNLGGLIALTIALIAFVPLQVKNTITVITVVTLILVWMLACAWQYWRVVDSAIR